MSIRSIVVIPCYNEAKRLDVDVLTHFSLSTSISILFINDGSKDDTLEVLQNICSRAPEHCSYLDLETNCGKGEATRQGLLWAAAEKFDIIGYMDADLSTSLTDIQRLIEILKNHPALSGVLGSRVSFLGSSIERSTLRHLAGRLFATLASTILGVSIYDTQCGAKFFRNNSIIQGAISKNFRMRWGFDIELISRILKTHPAIPSVVLCEMPLSNWKDKAGSKVRLVSSLISVFQLVWYRHRLRVR